MCSNNIFGRRSITSVLPNDLPKARLSVPLTLAKCKQLNFTPAFSAILAIDQQAELKTELLTTEFISKSRFVIASGLK